MSINPGQVASFATDAAPVERADLDMILVDVAAGAGAKVGEECERAALAYARECADVAFMLGFRLGKDAGQVEGYARGRAACNAT